MGVAEQLGEAWIVGEEFEEGAGVGHGGRRLVARQPREPRPGRPGPD
jgi:hypothetical protein